MHLLSISSLLNMVVVSSRHYVMQTPCQSNGQKNGIAATSLWHTACDAQKVSFSFWINSGKTKKWQFFENPSPELQIPVTIDSPDEHLPPTRRNNHSRAHNTGSNRPEKRGRRGFPPAPPPPWVSQQRCPTVLPTGLPRSTSGPSNGGPAS